MHKIKEYYGSTTLGERGQMVLPAGLRDKLKIKAKDRLLVFAGEKEFDVSTITLIKADAVSELMTKIFGGDLEHILKNKAKKK